MRILAAMLATVFAFSTPAMADSYTNARFGYTLTYPARTFAPQPESDNGDGRHFKALQGGADLAVWASYNSLNQAPASIADMIDDDCMHGSHPYRLVRPTVVVVSCPTAKGVLYDKTLIRGDTLTSFEFIYPESERARWDPLVGKFTLTPAK